VTLYRPPPDCAVVQGPEGAKFASVHHVPARDSWGESMRGGGVPGGYDLPRYIRDPLFYALRSNIVPGMASLWIIVAVLFIADAVLLQMLWRGHRRRQRLVDLVRTEPEPLFDSGPLEGLIEGLRKDIGADLDEMASRIKRLTMAIEEGIERVDRSERRIGATIKRAQEKLALAGYEDPGLEAEAEGLRLLDGEGGGVGQLPTVQPGVEDPGDRPSSIRGLTVRQLQKVRGL